MGAVFKSSHLGFLLSGEASVYLHDQIDFLEKMGLTFFAQDLKGSLQQMLKKSHYLMS